MISVPRMTPIAPSTKRPVSRSRRWNSWVAARSGLQLEPPAHQAVAQLDAGPQHVGQALSDDEHRAPCPLGRFAAPRQFQNLGRGPRGQPVERLLQNHQLRVERQRPGQRGAPALLLVHPGGPEPGHMLQAQHREHDLDASVNGDLTPVAPEAKRQGDVVIERQVLQQPVSGGKVSNAAAERERGATGQLRQVFSQHQDPSRGRPVQGQRVPPQGPDAAGRVSQQTHGAMPGNVEAQHRWGAVAYRDLVERQGRDVHQLTTTNRADVRKMARMLPTTAWLEAMGTSVAARRTARPWKLGTVPMMVPNTMPLTRVTPASRNASDRSTMSK